MPTDPRQRLHAGEGRTGEVDPGRPELPYTIVRATQFFEFVGAIAESGADGNAIRLPPAMMQPIAAEDVSAALADVAVRSR